MTSDRPMPAGTCVERGAAVEDGSFDCQFRVSLFFYCSHSCKGKRGEGSPYSITERRVPGLIAVLGSQPAGDVSHKPAGRLPLLSARPAVTPAALKRAATNFAAW